MIEEITGELYKKYLRFPIISRFAELAKGNNVEIPQDMLECFEELRSIAERSTILNIENVLMDMQQNRLMESRDLALCSLTVATRIARGYDIRYASLNNNGISERHYLVVIMKNDEIKWIVDAWQHFFDRKIVYTLDEYIAMMNSNIDGRYITTPISLVNIEY